MDKEIKKEGAVFFDGFDFIPGPVVSLKIFEKHSQEGKGLPFYWYSIVMTKTLKEVGKVSLKIGAGLQAYWGGNIGYEVDEPFRGHHYAYEAVRLLFPLARLHGMTSLYFSCDEDNCASFKTIEKLGGKLVTIGFPDKEYYAYSPDMAAQRVYKIDLN
jgi:predicted acetyltransferase